jgi:hypothetical protein
MALANATAASADVASVGGGKGLFVWLIVGDADKLDWYSLYLLYWYKVQILTLAMQEDSKRLPAGRQQQHSAMPRRRDRSSLYLLC